MLRTTHSHLALVALFLLSILVGCKKETDVEVASPGPTGGEDYSALQIVSSVSDSRIRTSNTLVVWQSDGLKKPFTGNGSVDERGGGSTPEDDIYWLHIGDVDQLDFAGQTLSATHVVVKDHIAFVSYHSRGDEHLGAIESIDLTDPQRPVVLGQVFFEEADVNAIEIHQQAGMESTKLWVALSDARKGGLLGEFQVKNGLFGGFKYVNLSQLMGGEISASANAIEHAGEFLYVTSGKSNGGVCLFKAETLEFLQSRAFVNAKYVAANGDATGDSKVVALQAGEQSYLRTDLLGKGEFSQETEIGGILHQNTDAKNSGKSTIHFQRNDPSKMYVAMGNAGFKMFDLSSDTPKELWKSPDGMVKSGNCNAITSDDEFIYVANGADGLAVFQLVPGEMPNQVFKWDLSFEDASVNYVQADGDLLFVAKGKGGLKILRRPRPGDLLPLTPYDESGRPTEMEEDVEICSELLPNIFNEALPEKQNATVAHPEFFSNVVPNQLYIQEDCEVNVTFILENAGYRNALGYYYYDASNPPRSPDDLTKIIIFANASAVGSGGEMAPGNTMRLLGSFAKNSVIGFFLIANAWDGSFVTNGLGTIYTEPAFNPGNSKQSLIFHDQECNSTVVCFEDIVTAWGGDKDYNDAIFQVTTTPATALNPAQYLQIGD
jgi:hypothetical protein